MKTLKQDCQVKKLLSLIKVKIVAWSLTSSAQCLPKIFQYDNFYAKFLWALVFFLFSGLTVWFLIEGLLDFLQFDVVSKIRVFNEQNLVFPVVTNCDTNPFTTKKAENLIVGIEKENYFSISFAGMSIMESFAKCTYYLFSGMHTAFNLADEQKKELGLSLENILQLCYFNLVPCNKNDFSWIFSPLYLVL